MFASTIRARKILRTAFAKALVSAPEHTYTEKTTENDDERRSIVFPCYGDTEKVLEIAKQLFIESGYTKSIPKMTSCDVYGTSAYIRVIAYKI